MLDKKVSKLLEADFAVEGVCLFGAHQLVHDVLLGLCVEERDLRAKADGVGIRVERDDFGAGNLVLEPGHLDVVDGGKAFLRCVVFGVFAQIALRTGINQFLQYARAFNIF